MCIHTCASSGAFKSGHELLRNVLELKSVFWLFDLLLPAAKNLSINLCVLCLCGDT